MKLIEVFKANPNHDPKNGRFTSAPGGATHTRDGTPKSFNKRRQSASNEVGAIASSKFHDKIPLGDIFNTLSKHGFKAVQEDGTPWSGLLLGAEGRASIGIHDTVANKDSGRTLELQWYKHRTGRYEVNSYIS